jgi:hypothetical protein
MENSGQDISRKQQWAGRIVSAIPVLFLLMDGAMKLFKPSFVVKATTELGFPESTIVGIGIILLVSVIMHLVPRTSFLGALLITAYLGGAVASKVRVGSPVFDIGFALIVAVLLWGGFWLRERSVRAVLPLSRT